MTGKREIDSARLFKASILTLYPQMFPAMLSMSLAGDSLKRGDWHLDVHDLRGFGIGKHKCVDDRPAGGGPGMVLRCDVLSSAIDAMVTPNDTRPRLLMSPRGKPLTQSHIRELSQGEGVIIVCGRFEGVDERVIAARQLTEVSIGDYILSGGEIAAHVLLDACVRLLPNVMGAHDSGDDESFENGLLEYPHYTRPRDWEGHTIPDVLLGGNHAFINKWRHEQSLELTRQRRPDLLQKKVM